MEDLEGQFVLHSKFLSWTTGWDTCVCILENNTDHKVYYPHEAGCRGTSHSRNLENVAHTCIPFRPDIETLGQTTPTDATLGGLDKTIAEIRDLIEIPLHK